MNMKSLILYDSYFGNTQQIAKHVADKLNSGLLKIDQYKEGDLYNIELLIIGTPTRAFTYTENVKKFLKQKPNLKDIQFGVFDTRINTEKVDNKLLTFMAKRFGYASDPLSSKLEKLGGKQILKPVGFFVDDTEGPITKGEMERVDNWISSLT